MKISLVCVLAFGLGLAAMPALAHHSFAAEYDNKAPVDLTGTVTKVEWMNPHARFYLDVKDEKGTVTNWEFELGSPNALMRIGWPRLVGGRLADVGGHLLRLRNPAQGGVGNLKHIGSFVEFELHVGRQVRQQLAVGVVGADFHKAQSIFKIEPMPKPQAWILIGSRNDQRS